MNAARFLISGDGDFENGWKRLLGFNKGLPSISSTGERLLEEYSGGSSLSLGAC